MAFNATFNNILVISWRSVLLVECLDKTTDLSQVTDKLYDIILHRAHLTCAGFELTTLLVIGSDCIGSFKSSYHMITTTIVPVLFGSLQTFSYTNVYTVSVHTNKLKYFFLRKLFDCILYFHYYAYILT